MKREKITNCFKTLEDCRKVYGDQADKRIECGLSFIGEPVYFKSRGESVELRDGRYVLIFDDGEI